MKERIKLFKWFWVESFKYKKPKSKLWVMIHGWMPCFKFMKKVWN